MPKRVAIGVVTSDRMQKTRRVEIGRLVRHPKYGKYQRRRTVCYVHDEQEESGLGDTVEIVEATPTSKMKRWQLVRVVEKSRAVDAAALLAGRRRAAEEKAAEASAQATTSAGQETTEQKTDEAPAED
jgi:small subunit ribosomal protein S17